MIVAEPVEVERRHNQTYSSHEGRERFDASALLEGLDESQRRAVTIDAQPLAVLAPAGSGKTRVLTRRIAYRIGTESAGASHVLALTFTRKAASELGARLRRLGVDGSVTAGTFHSVALAQLRAQSTARRREMPGVLDRKGRLLFSLVGGRGAAAALAVQEVAAEIEWAKARLVPPDRYAEAVELAQRTTPRPVSELAEVYGRYEAAKRRRGLVDFDDLLWWCASEMDRDPEFAAAQHFRFRHIFVDELQDVNPAQWQLLRKWLGDRTDLFVVGDEAQAIYGFAGADARYLSRFAELFPTATTVRLECNYRSTPQVVAAGAAVLGRPAGVERPLPRARGADGPVPDARTYADEHSEARGVARAVRAALNRGLAPRSVAVLYRTNAQSAAFEATFSALDIPFRIAGAARFVDRPEVRALLDELAATDRGRSHSLISHLADLDAMAAGEDDPSPERREHAEALAELGRDYLAAEGAAGTLGGFMSWLRASMHSDDGPSGDAVDLMTFHRAKGLEWAAVWVTGLEQGLVPVARAKTPAAIAEERRLLHVALSRARRELHLSWAASRRFKGRNAKRRPSPYLEAVLAANRPGAHDRKGDVATGIAAARAAARAAAPQEAFDDTDRALLAALKLWRKQESVANGVPAFTIFHDATLRAICACRPSSKDELLAVSGVGPAKLERYGEAVLHVVEQAVDLPC